MVLVGDPIEVSAPPSRREIEVNLQCSQDSPQDPERAVLELSVLNRLTADWLTPARLAMPACLQPR